ncbi:MAG: TetR/AcrR family transcriptional regulator [Deltaproteobacteria bacterium]|nr:TetR/AcrR family transcriptional regulator [Deltaproteobacteria bacterium]
MKARTRASRLDPSERRARLLAHALGVFGRRGLAAGRHAEIARESGVAVSTVFVYFPTRAELVGAVLDEVEQFYVGMVERVLALELPAPRVLLALATAFADSVDEHPEYARLWLEWSAAIRDEVWPRFIAFQDRLTARVARIVERGKSEGTVAASVDAEEDARVIVAAAPVVAQMKFSGRSPEQVARFLRTVVETTLGPLGAERPR